MRPPNYRIGWYIPDQIAALTHFHPDVTAEDFMGVVQTGQDLLQRAHTAFHVIIDNRRVSMSTPARLSDMQKMVPYMNHPLLRWVVVIKPTQLLLSTEGLAIEQEGAIQLKNVSSLQEALHFLQQTTVDLNWHQADLSFFPE